MRLVGLVVILGLAFLLSEDRRRVSWRLAMVSILNFSKVGSEMLFGKLSSDAALYALCGFANLGSLAILISGIGSLAPSRKQETVELGLRCLIAGTLVKWITAALAALLVFGP